MLINNLTNIKPRLPPMKNLNGIILLIVDEQLEKWQKHSLSDIAEEVEAENENEVNRRNKPNRSITTEPSYRIEIKVAIRRLK